MPDTRSGLTRRRERQGWLMVLPLIAVLALVALWPLARSIWFSFTDAALDNIAEARFIGIENYWGEYGVLQDPQWWHAVANTLRFTVISVALETLLGLGLALLLDTPSRLRTWLRAAVLVPWAIPTIVSAKMWGWMLHDQFGILNAWMVQLGILAKPLAWAADPALAMTTVIVVDVWKTTPFMALLILAALQMLPKEIYEAARVDGVKPIAAFRHVTLPLILPAILVAVVFRMLDAMRIFDLIYVLTSNSKDTQSMSTYVRQQLVEFQLVGPGSAASTLLFLLIALLAVLWLGFNRRRLAEST